MRQADIIKQAFEAFRTSATDVWKDQLRSRLINNDYNRDELEVIADFCEQAALVVTEVRENKA